MLELLLADGGLVLDDLREGERTLVKLYARAYEAVHGAAPEEIPYVFDFRM